MTLPESSLHLLQKLRTRLLDRDREQEEERKRRFQRPVERVVNSPIVKWKPIDRTAAFVISPANWIHKPDAFKQKKNNITESNNEERKVPDKMSNKAGVINMPEEGAPTLKIPGQTYVSDRGLRITTVNGEQLVNLEDMQLLLIEEINKMPKEISPGVKAAQDARTIMDELLHKIGGDMEKFRVMTKQHLEDIRMTRMAMVTEVAAMTAPLREVRQFFLASDYKDEISRLKEFVDLCERLVRLKDSGFLDRISDTMLSLSA